MSITTHVLDTSKGRAAAGVHILLEVRADSGGWESISRGVTDGDGRLRTLLPEGQPLKAGVYRLTFDTARYFESLGAQSFYPEVVVTFETLPGEKHYHVPLLVSPFGYSTYRGT